MSPHPIRRPITDTPHFDDDAWLSFVRGVLPAHQVRVMRAHLDHSCVECLQTHQNWKRFLEIAAREVPDVAPDSAARFIKEAFTLPRRIPFREGLALVAERVFDSLQDPLPAGIRGSGTFPRQLLYEAGGYLIDLWLEQSKGGKGTLTGQVVQAWTEEASRCAGVVLVRESVVLRQTIANSIGEFQFDCESWDNLKICVGIWDGTFIEVPLPNAGRGPASR